MSSDIDPELDIGKIRTASANRGHDLDTPRNWIPARGPNEAIVGFSILGMPRTPLCYIHITKALIIASMQGTKVFLNSIGEDVCELCVENLKQTGRIYYE